MICPECKQVMVARKGHYYCSTLCEIRAKRRGAARRAKKRKDNQ